MSNLCPLCNSPMDQDVSLPITEPPVFYDALVEELGVTPERALAQGS